SGGGSLVYVESNDQYPAKMSVPISPQITGQTVARSATAQQGIAVEVHISKWQQLAFKDAPVAVAQDKVDPVLWTYFLNNMVHFKVSIKVKDVFHLGDLLHLTTDVAHTWIDVVIKDVKLS